MNLPNSMQELIIFLQKNQRFSFIFILVIAFFLFWIWGGNSQEELFKIDSKIAKPEIKSGGASSERYRIVPGLELSE